MAKFDSSILEQYGIKGSTVIAYNPSYEFLYEEETKAGLEGFEVGKETELGAVNVMTGIYTGRSPKDKYIVDDAQSHDKVWWTTDAYKNDNHPMSEEVWGKVKEIALRQEALRRRCLLRCQRGHTSGRALRRRGGLAGSLRQEHVHPAHRG